MVSGTGMKSKIMSVNKRAHIIQRFGLGDAIYSQTIAHRFMEVGYEISWGVDQSMVDSLQRAYPDIKWMDWRIDGADHNCMLQKVINNVLQIPIFWGVQILKCSYDDCMKSKYSIYGWDYKDWRIHGMYDRNLDRERDLMAMYGIIEGQPYNLINQNFQTDFGGRLNIDPANGFKNIYINPKQGYSLFDYSTMIECATEVHAVSSSILFILELLNLSQPLHLYPRPSDMKYKQVDYLFTKNYNLH